MSYRDISVGDLKPTFSYDPQTGEIHKAGKPVGYVCSQGRYRGVSIRGRNVMFHHVAWALMTGEWPQDTIDHINRDGCDNRWCNLRAATQNQQQANRRPWGRSGIRGVHWDRGKWVACVRHDGKTVNLGRFDTKEAAAAVAYKERQRIWGEFAA